MKQAKRDPRKHKYNNKKKPALADHFSGEGIDGFGSST
jgi:hypothetical protein